MCYAIFVQAVFFKIPDKDISELSMSNLSTFSLSSGTPSAPRNLVSLINDTALFLQWMPPSDTGGREDITYNILCQRCDGRDGDSGVTQCEPCEPDLRFIPRPLGLTGTSVAILDFAMHATYTFHVEAANGVTGLGVSARSLANVTVNTHQAGELQSSCSRQCYFTVLFDLLCADPTVVMTTSRCTSNRII